MKLYHYVPKHADALKKGLLSVSKIPEELLKYAQRAGSQDPSQITRWLEKSLPGRCRAISVLTEPIRREHTDPMLQDWVDTKDLVEIDYTQLLKDDLVEAVYCKTGSDAAGFNEKIDKISCHQIDFSPLPWHLCSQEKGLFFGAVRHYFLVMQDGVIPPKYLKIIHK